ncbi:MAG: KDO2-lipid IV(A) lauroyltransferase [Verrucomicrobiales bacterium]|jgi:KDO2-lipid IV(A) lauroyltransferase
MPTKLSIWKRCRFRLEALGLRFAVKVLPMLSRRALLRFARGMSWVAYRVDGRGRKISDDNLQAVFPDKAADERRQITRQSYFHQTMCALDLLWAPGNLTESTMSRYIRYSYDDEEEFRAIIKGGPSVWVTLHYGNFEWMSVAWGLSRGNMPMIVAEDFRNPALTPIYKKLREHTGNTFIPQERAVMRLLKHLKRGGQAAFLTDLRVKPSKAATIIENFGMKTSMTAIHAYLAQRTGVALVPTICLPQPDGTYTFHIHKSLVFDDQATLQVIAQQCWDVFEETIRETPAPWLWMYKHWRYLPSDPGNVQYPSYATRSKAFAEMEASLESHSD